MTALVKAWVGFKTTDDIHRIALVSMGLFFIFIINKLEETESAIVFISIFLNNC